MLLASLLLHLSFVCWFLAHHHIHAEQHSVDTFGEYSKIEEDHDGFDKESEAADALSHDSQVIFMNAYAFPVDVLWKDPILPFDQVNTLIPCLSKICPHY